MKLFNRSLEDSVKTERASSQGFPVIYHDFSQDLFHGPAVQKTSACQPISRHSTQPKTRDTQTSEKCKPAATETQNQTPDCTHQMQTSRKCLVFRIFFIHIHCLSGIFSPRRCIWNLYTLITAQSASLFTAAHIDQW